MKSIFASACAHAHLAALLAASCHLQPKAFANLEAVTAAPGANAASDAWQTSLQDAAERDFVTSTDGLTPVEEEAAGRKESCEAFKYTGHVLDEAVATLS